MKKAGGHGGGGGHDGAGGMRWLLTYADLITLLMVFFIVLAAMSQVDQNKMALLANSLANAFTPFWEDKPFPFPGLGSGTGLRGTGAPATPDGAPTITEQLNTMARAFQDRNMNVRTIADQIAVDLKFPDVFEADMLTIKPTAKPMLQRVAQIILLFEATAEVGVYRKTLPPGETRDPWTLTALEAAALSRFLHQECGIAADRLSANGLGPNAAKVGIDPSLGMSDDAGVTLVISTKAGLPSGP